MVHNKKMQASHDACISVMYFCTGISRLVVDQLILTVPAVQLTDLLADLL